MNAYVTKQRVIAFFFTVLFTITNLIPIQVWALTSGPAQPEMAAFQPAGVSDMVDVFSGDFKYNIPLLDVDGYPVNLSYQSGVGVDDEASWVGLGWSLNVGAINRQLRGLPDDLSGDMVTSEFIQKPKVTIGGSVFVKPEFKGKLFNGKLELGIFNDNYTGIGASVGANAGINVGLVNSGALDLGAGLGITSSTSDGVDVSPSLSLSLKGKMDHNMTASFGFSGSLGYNTRSGLKALTLSQSFSLTKPWQPKRGEETSGGTNLDLGGSSYHYNTDPFYPKGQITYVSNSASFTPAFGAGFFAGFVGFGGTGYVNLRAVKEAVQQKPAYGFLYADRGKSRPDALMDFTREKDNPIINELPNLAVPVHTPDLFSFSSQTGVGQFRLYRSSGVLFDDQSIDNSNSSSAGFDIGLGSYFHGGVSHYQQTSVSATRKWTEQNRFNANADFQENNGLSYRQDPVFFRQVGEKVEGDEIMENSMQQEDPLAVTLLGKYAADSLYKKGQSITASNIKRETKAKRRAIISYLTAKEAKHGAVDKQIINYNLLTPESNSTTIAGTALRDTGFRKPHHISEFTITDEVGKRMVYGQPVYNRKHWEYTFAVGTGVKPDANNLVPIEPAAGNKINTIGKGLDWYYTKQEQPAYATSHLLTAILSPDYVDVTGNGISNDDRGTAIKFNYSKLPHLLKWRTPMAKGKMATHNKGLLADNEDEKGSIVYGEKEQWYLHSIETKTKVAYFILEKREDALGAKDWSGEVDPSNTQMRLSEVRLFSKADMTKPIKTVVLKHSYRLCEGVPNHSADISLGTGKLTLNTLYFTYGNSPKGKEHKYVFNYNNDAAYAYNASDRWGTYKDKTANPSGFTYDEYPYTLQEKSKTDEYASIWHLKEIKLPTGGTIRVDYESDDYAYVQNKKAMKMVILKRLVDAENKATGLNSAKKLVVKLEEGLPPDIPIDDIPKQTKWFKETYLNGADYIYGKLSVNMTNGIAKSAQRKLRFTDYTHDFVSCYAKVNGVKVVEEAGEKIAYIEMEDIRDGGVSVNPFCISAWQKVRMEYPKYAYPGYENRPDSRNAIDNFTATISAIFNAFKTLGELTGSYNERALRKGFTNEVELNKSFVRLTDIKGRKLGGGVRVKRISISDNWEQMVGATNGHTTTYGMEYDYTTTENGKVISSGVASYEPTLGGDENPLHQPVPYLQRIKGAVNNMFALERPFGESYFPAPSVGYSKITVRNIGASGTAEAHPETGWTISEFYTAKEFPAQVVETGMQKYESKPKTKLNLFGGIKVHELVLSQGYTILLNDMHGKQKAEKIYDQSGSLLSSAEYEYFADRTDAGEWKLNNKVRTIESDGLVKEKVIGRDIELFTDMRECEYANYGTAINLGADIFPTIPFVLPHWPIKNNDEYRLFRSACIAKVVQTHGIVKKVTKMQSGSSVAAENVAFDPNTGDVLVTKTYNEHKKPIYNVNIPAYWIYNGMSSGLRTGTFIQSFQTDVNGVLNAQFKDFMQPGDELLTRDGQLYWVVDNKEVVNGVEAVVPSKRLIDRNGKLVKGFNGWVKLIRTGNRNQISASATAVVCMKDPLKGNQLSFIKDQELKHLQVIDAKATAFSEDWDGDKYCATCPEGYVLDVDGQNCRPVIKLNETHCTDISYGSSSYEYGSRGAELENSTGQRIRRESTFWGGQCTIYTIANKDSNNYSANASISSPVMSATPNLCNYTNDKVFGYQYCGPLNSSGIWLKSGSNNYKTPFNEMVWVEFCIDIPETKEYFIGYGADNMMTISIDGVGWKGLSSPFNSDNYRFWYVKPISLTAGKHKIKLQFENRGETGAAGLEIYNNTYNELINADDFGNGINKIFKTTDLINLQYNSSYTYNLGRLISTGTTVYRYTKLNNQPIDVCGNDKLPLEKRVNPYVTGFKGNWRPSESEVYQVNRTYGTQATTQQKGINAEKDGHYLQFTPYHVKGSEGKWQTGSVNADKWVTATSMTLYDKWGQELENKDALNRYSAASFSFLGNTPAAVASNAQHREIFYESFEDLKFRYKNKAHYLNCDTSFLNFEAFHDYLSATESHTGRYAIQFTSTFDFNTQVHNLSHRIQDYLAINEQGEYVYKSVPGLYNNGFQPVSGKSYLISFWAKGGNKLDKNSPFALTVNGTAVNLQWKATVEGWKLIEGVFTPTGGNLQFTISGSGLLDDLRIVPNDGQIKTFAYDDRNYRLMAELDENNFATFYEYDEEGILNRVKKETERGIMTIKETRSTYKRN